MELRPGDPVELARIRERIRRLRFWRGRLLLGTVVAFLVLLGAAIVEGNDLVFFGSALAVAVFGGLIVRDAN